MTLTKNADGKHVCHCGKLARNDESEYAWVCNQWPTCETTFEDKRVDELIVGDIVQDLGVVEDIDAIGCTPPMISFRSPNRGATIRQWRGDHIVKVKSA